MEAADEAKAPEVKDGGVRAWIVCAASFWTNGLVMGLVNTFSILYAALLKEYQDKEDNEDIAFIIAWIGSLNIALTGILSPISSILILAIGLRPTVCLGAILGATGLLASSFTTNYIILYFTYGVCLGFGMALILSPSYAILGHYFHKRIGLATGIVSLGGAIFTIVMPFLWRHIIDHYGFCWMLRLLSILFGSQIICAFVWKPILPPSISNMEKSRRNKCVVFITTFCKLSLWKNKTFCVFAASVFIFIFGYMVPLIHIVQHATKRFPDYNPNLIVTVLGTSSLGARLVCGKVSDLKCMNRISMFQIFVFIYGVVTMTLPFVNHFYGLLCVMALLGVCDGCTMVLQPLVIYEILGAENMGQGYAYILSIMSTATLISVPVSGLSYDLTNSYTLAFLTAAAFPLMSASLLFIAVRLNATESRQRDVKK